jgi:hypothetical protein
MMEKLKHYWDYFAQQLSFCEKYSHKNILVTAKRRMSNIQYYESYSFLKLVLTPENP